MASVFINPKTDFAFKKIFGSKKSKDILISFLDAILYDGTNTILDVEILDPYQAPRIKGIKDSYLDVKATITGDRTVIIEMQVLNVLGFEKRVLYNAAKAYSIQLDKGEDYTLLNPVIALTITDFEMFADSPKVISRYRLKEHEDLTDYSEGIELVFVELPKFKKELTNLQTLVDKWIYFLKSANDLESVPKSFDEIPALNHAFKVAKQSRLSRKELEIMENRQMFLHDNRNAMRKATEDGLIKGRKEGIQQGRKEGIQQGIQQERLELARQLLDVLDIETIALKTGLTIQNIETLR